MEDGGGVVGHCGVEVLVQQALLDQIHDGLLRQVGVHCPGAIAQQGGEVVDLPGLSGFQEDRYGGALPGANQVLLHGRHRQQRGDGRVVLVHPPVGKDDNVGPLPVRPVHRHRQPVQYQIQVGAFVIEQGHGGCVEARSVHGLDLHQVGGGENGVVDLEHPAVVRLFLEQIPVIGRVDGGVGDDLLPDSIHGWVGHLGEELLEVGEEGPIPVVQHRQGDIHPHGGGGLRPGAGHGQDGVVHVLIGVAEGLLKAAKFLPAVPLHPLVWDRQVGQTEQIGVQPLSIGLPGGVALLQFLVVNDLPLPQVRQQHLARPQPGLFHDMLWWDVQHPHLGGENEPAVFGEVVPGRAQAVAVQHGSHHVPVGEQDGRRAIPGLHEGGVVVV